MSIWDVKFCVKAVWWKLLCALKKFALKIKCGMKKKITYSSKLTLFVSRCTFKPYNMNFGPHQAKAPVTNATQVKPSVDNMNDGFLDKSTKKGNQIY